MHLLPGVLTLLLAAGPAAAGISDLAGAWQGTVVTTPDNCAWKVNASAKERNGLLMGNFSYSGPCAKGVGTGLFTASPEEGGCYAVSAGVRGLPKMNFTACFVNENHLTFESLLLSGSLKLTPDKRSAAFIASSPLGSARGTLKKIFSPPSSAGKKGSKGAPDAKTKPLKPPTLEIYDGSRQGSPQRP
jgi:hypothetical protein